ncbi:MAG: hypothetical protein ABR533_01680 [Desulfonatronovibrio sp.]
MKSSLLLRICLIIIFLFTLSSIAYGFEQEKLKLRTFSNHNFKSEFKKSDAKVSSTRYGIRADYSYFALLYDYTDYSWSRINNKPWNGLHNISLSARKRFVLNEDWMLSTGAAVRSLFEKEISRSVGAGADITFIRLFSNGWSAGIGIAGVYHPVTSALFPVITIGYAPAGDKGFSVRAGFPETYAKYAFNPNLSIKAYGDYMSRAYRLENNSPVISKGYFREQGIKFGLQMEVKPVNAMNISFGPYYIVDRKWKTYNKSGSRLNTEKLDNTPGAEISISWRF